MRHVDQRELRGTPLAGVEQGVHDVRRPGKPREPDHNRGSKGARS
ncbi:hypothetical protein [Burkholderia gladioli]|nr:hypothetical protein [Burkholderia gladioli]